jgi:hypothetical protein
MRCRARSRIIKVATFLRHILKMAQRAQIEKFAFFSLTGTDDRATRRGSSVCANRRAADPLHQRVAGLNR